MLKIKVSDKIDWIDVSVMVVRSAVVHFDDGSENQALWLLAGV